MQKSLVAVDGSAAASATSFAELAEVPFGAVVGTTDLDFIENEIGATDVAVFNTLADVVSAMTAGQIEATVIGLPTAYFMTAVQLENGVIGGVFNSADGGELGMLFTEGSELVGCINSALATLEENGTLASISEEWLQAGGDIPTIAN